MARHGTTKAPPTRAQALRSAAAEALERLAADERITDGRAGIGNVPDAAERHDALARRVLRFAMIQCAEAHHPEGIARLGGDALSASAPAAIAAERALREAGAPDPYELGAVHEALLGTALTADDEALRVTRGGARRSAGAHYTPRMLAREVVERALAGLLPDDARPEDILTLRVCDAAMGAGAFLLAACEVLAERLTRARATCSQGVGDSQNTGDLSCPPPAALRASAPPKSPAPPAQGGDRDATALAQAQGDVAPASIGVDEKPTASASAQTRQNVAPAGLDVDQNSRAAALAQARRDVARACLFGVDKDPAAVALARAALWIATASEGEPAAFLEGSLRVGDALVGPPNAWPPWPRGVEPFDWRAAFPEVLAERGGFDAIVGNPPWISYAGRAAQPLDEELFEFYLRTSPAFFGYRNLQALFVHRAATLLRPGGRLGLVIPTSMSDLGGYEPSRRAHDAWCAVDGVLPDFGDRFDDVFQPCMGLFSTRRPAPARVARAEVWPLERNDLDARSAALLARLDALPKLPAATFGERGFQSMKDDVSKLRPFGDPPRGGDTGLRIGSDVAAFRRAEPSFRCDPRDFGGRFRREDEWRAVDVLIRQTARFPMACVADGAPFRNSVLAGFAGPEMPAEMLVAYLNAWPVRWFHYVRHRDARQGMPQMKIVHLRALPSPRDDATKRAALASLGASLSLRNDGVRPDEQRAIDDLAGDLLGLDDDERGIVRTWAETFTSAAGNREAPRGLGETQRDTPDGDSER